MSKVKAPKVKTELADGHYQHVHIDSGSGIAMSIVDKGVQRGICFEVSADYIGCPSLQMSMQIDWDPNQFLDKMEAMIKSAREDLKGIDWEKRRSQK